VRITEKGADHAELTFLGMDCRHPGFLLLVGMVSAYNERYHLEKSQRLAALP
jgi:hypothetical protein